jgi:transposase
MEMRRMRAADLFVRGVSQANIARELGVAHQTVSDWHEKWREGGRRR